MRWGSSSSRQRPGGPAPAGPGLTQVSATSAINDTPQPHELSWRRLWLILGALMTGMLLAALDQTIVSTALPTIVGDLGGASHLSWVVTAYLLASTASMPLWGKLGDMYGRKAFFQAAIVIFLVGSALSGLSGSMIELIAFRAIQGIGGGAVLPGKLSRVHHVIDYLGALLIALAAICLVLLTSLGGTTYAWGSAPIIILAVLASI
jgi:MFS family permease